MCLILEIGFEFLFWFFIILNIKRYIVARTSRKRALIAGAFLGNDRLSTGIPPSLSGIPDDTTVLPFN